MSDQTCQNILTKKLETREFTQWDELVDSSTHGTIFHKSDWLNACSKLLGKELRIYGCFKEEKLVGGCSFYISKGKGGLKIASSIVSMSPYGGVVLAPNPSTKIRDQEQQSREIINELCNSLQRERFDDIQITFPPEFTDIRPFTWNKWKSSVYYTYYLSLEGFEERITKNPRRDIEKGLRNGVKIERSDDIRTFYEIFQQTFVRQGLKPPVNRKFFETIYAMIQKNNWGDMWFAKTQTGDVAAAEIVIYDKRMAYRWSAATHPELRKTGTYPLLLLYTSFKGLQTKGFKEVNLMAANTQQLAKFVTGFNPTLRPYYKVEKASKKFMLINTIRDTFKK